MVVSDNRQRSGRSSLLFFLVATGLFFLVTWLVRRESWLRVDDRLAQELAQARSFEVSADPTSTDWFQWRGPRRDGSALQAAKVSTWGEAGPTVLWQAKTGLGYSSLAVSGQRVCTLVRREDEEVLLCWDKETGKSLWEFAYPCTFRNDYPGTRGTPSFDDDRVYAIGAAGRLSCVHADTGKELWHYELLASQQVSPPTWGLACSPLVVADRVFAYSNSAKNSSLLALDKLSGRVIWQTGDESAGYSSPLLVTAAGRNQLLFLMGEKLVSVAPETGQRYWEYPWLTDHQVNAAMPVFVPMTSADQADPIAYLFLTSGYGKGCALLKLGANGDVPTVETVYEHRKFCAHFASPVFYKGHIFGFHNDLLACLELATGKVKWSQRGFAKGSLLLVNDELLVLGENGKLALVAANPEKYQERLVHPLLSDRCWSAPALSGNKLFVRNEEKLLCLEWK